MAGNYGQGRERKKTFRFNDQEAEELARLSEPFKDESKFIRYAIANVNNETNLSIEEREEIKEALKIVRHEMSRVGGNLNQLARTFNTKGTINFKTLQATHEDLYHQFADLMDTLKNIERRLS